MFEECKKRVRNAISRHLRGGKMEKKFSGLCPGPCWGVTAPSRASSCSSRALRSIDASFAGIPNRLPKFQGFFALTTLMSGRVPSAIFAMQNIMVFFHFGTGIIMVYHGIFFWNLLRTMYIVHMMYCLLATLAFTPEIPLEFGQNYP